MSLGTGAVWSDLDKPIIHFGSPAPEPPSNPVLTDKNGNWIYT